MSFNVTPDTTIGELIMSGCYGKYSEYFFTDMTPDHWNTKLKEYGFEKKAFLETLKRIEEMASSEKDYRHYIYKEEERLSEWDKKNVCIIEFPGPAPNMPYALVVPGGGFNRQWGIIEGFSIANKLNSLGITAFVLFYRTKQEPVINKAIEDMHNAIRFIDNNADKFQIRAGEYIIGGFSAGATLSAEIGSTNLGWMNALIHKPQMIFLGYPAIMHLNSYNMYIEAPKDSPARTGMLPFLRRLGGPEFNETTIAPFELANYINESYPPCYITACEDDDTVPIRNSYYLDEILNKYNVPHKINIGKTGGHSFGLGNGLEVEGWLEDMITFWKSL